jgi:EpsI family protein
MNPKPARLPRVGPETLPEIMGDFTGRDEPLDERVVAASNAEIMLNRVYRNVLGDSVTANVGVWTRYDTGIPHNPQDCYSRAGWEIASRRNLMIPMSDHKPLQIKQFVFQRATSRIAVAYWVNIGDDTITESEGLRQLRQRLRRTGGNLPPLVKVMLQTDAKDIVQAEARLSRAAAALAPYTVAIR